MDALGGIVPREWRTDVEDARGARARLGIGSLLVAVYDADRDEFPTIARIASSPSEEEWGRLRALLDETRTPQRPARVVSRLVPDVWVQPTYEQSALFDT